MSANPFSPNEGSANLPDVRVIGLGGAGGRIVAELIARGFPAASVIALDAEEGELAANPAALRFAVQCRRLRGLGTGGDPENGRAAAEENLDQLRSIIAGSQILFLVGGLGGGFASSATVVIAKLAKQAGAMTIGAFVTPFESEGKRRADQAQTALDELRSACDAVLMLANDLVFRLIPADASVVESFNTTNRLLADNLCGIWRLISSQGPIALSFADVCGLLRRQNADGSFASVEVSGEKRAEQIVTRLKTHPLLDDNPAFEEADTVLVSFAGGTSLAMAEVNQVMKFVTERVPQALVKFGVNVSDEFTDCLIVTLIATRKETVAEASEHHAPEDKSRARLDSEFLSREPVRTTPRMVPPAPELAPEKRAQIVAQHTKTGRGRSRAKSKQAQLQFDLVSKGRFEKSEPTIHRGEDLDLPTYIRRGMALN